METIWQSYYPRNAPAPMLPGGISARYVSTAALTSNTWATAAWFAGSGTDGGRGVLVCPDSKTANRDASLSRK
jgi:hypothetical protein